MKNAKPRMKYLRDADEPEQPAEFLDPLEKYQMVTPYISRYTGDPAGLDTPVLSHPDLHLGNLFVDPATNQVTSIIDWQGAAFSPLILQAEIPRMVRHVELLEFGLTMPERPENYDDLDVAEQRAADGLYESALCQKYYEHLLAKNYPQYYDAMLHNLLFKTPLVGHLSDVCGCWDNREVYKLRSSLMRIAKDWSTLESAPASCPIAFSDEKVRRHNDELENIDCVSSVVNAFQEERILPADGRVDPNDYGYLKAANQEQKKLFLSLSRNTEEIEMMSKTWPWEDWPERSGA